MNAHVQVPLGEICTVNPRAPRGAYPENTVVSFVPMAAVDEELGAIAHPEDRPIRAVSKGYTAFEEGMFCSRRSPRVWRTVKLHWPGI